MKDDGEHIMILICKIFLILNCLWLRVADLVEYGVNNLTICHLLGEI